MGDDLAQVQYILHAERHTLMLLYTHFCSSEAVPAHQQSSLGLLQQSMGDFSIDEPLHAQRGSSTLYVQGITFERIVTLCRVFQLFPSPELVPDIKAFQELFCSSVVCCDWLESNKAAVQPDDVVQVTSTPSAGDSMLALRTALLTPLSFVQVIFIYVHTV